MLKKETRCPDPGNNGQVSFEVFSLTGEKVFSDAIMAQKGENELIFNGQNLSPEFVLLCHQGVSATSHISLIVKNLFIPSLNRFANL